MGASWSLSAQDRLERGWPSMKRCEACGRRGTTSTLVSHWQQYHAGEDGHPERAQFTSAIGGSTGATEHDPQKQEAQERRRRRREDIHEDLEDQFVNDGDGWPEPRGDLDHTDYDARRRKRQRMQNIGKRDSGDESDE